MIQSQKTKKKKRTSKKWIYTNLYRPDEEDSTISIVNIEAKLFKIFKNHIGSDNSISAYELFFAVYLKDPLNMDVFHRNYLYQILKKVIARLRNEEKIFVVCNASNFFVLKSDEEARAFSTRIDRVISSLEGVKTKADNWVRNKSWRKLQDE